MSEFLERGLYGFYLAVTREGEVQAGDPIVELDRDPRGFRVSEVALCYARTTTSKACDAQPTSTCFRKAGVSTSARGSTGERRNSHAGGDSVPVSEPEPRSYAVRMPLRFVVLVKADNLFVRAPSLTDPADRLPRRDPSPPGSRRRSSSPFSSTSAWSCSSKPRGNRSWSAKADL